VGRGQSFATKSSKFVYLVLVAISFSITLPIFLGIFKKIVYPSLTLPYNKSACKVDIQNKMTPSLLKSMFRYHALLWHAILTITLNLLCISIKNICDFGIKIFSRMTWQFFIGLLNIALVFDILVSNRCTCLFIFIIQSFVLKKEIVTTT